MHAKKRELSQEELFKSRLDQMLDPKHPLFRLLNGMLELVNRMACAPV